MPAREDALATVPVLEGHGGTTSRLLPADDGTAESCPCVLHDQLGHGGHAKDLPTGGDGSAGREHVTCVAVHGLTFAGVVVAAPSDAPVGHSRRTLGTPPVGVPADRHARVEVP